MHFARFNLMNALKDLKTIQNANQCLRWWLVHCYLYYVANQPILTDSQFDLLTSWLKMGWNQINHPHKALISLDDLNAGSGFGIGKYPLIVEMAANQLLRDLETNTAPKELAKPARKGKVTATDTYTLYDSLFGS